MLMAMSWFGRDRDYRAEYPVLILFAVLGMSIMVSASDLLTLYVGLELQSLAPMSLPPSSAPTRARPRPGLKYFVLGALASGILLYGISLLYGFTGTTMLDGIALALGTDGISRGELFGLVFVFAGLAFKVSAVPFHMWTPDVYEGAPTPVTAFFASAPKVAAMALLVRVSVEAMGPATDSWRQIIIFMALASTVLGGVAAIGQSNIKRPARLQLDQQCRLRPGRPRRRHAEGRRRGPLLHDRLYRHDARRLPGRSAHARSRRPAGRGIASAGRPVATRPDARAGDGDLHVQPRRNPALVRLLAQIRRCSTRRSRPTSPGSAAVAIATSVIGAYYYIMIVKLMYFDAAAPALPRPANRSAPV
jgi:NADH-quinone oxidoreductase subunit N